MTRLLTAQELSRKFDNLQAGTIPAMQKTMTMAVLNVEGQAKRNCTPGHSPYYKAPYSDDNDPRRDPVHMRDTIKGEVITEGTSVHGVVGTPKLYSLYVHEGTSKMEARPFILDAIMEKDQETRALLSKAIEDHVRSQCV